jgi:hypothetical protein
VYALAAALLLPARPRPGTLIAGFLCVAVGEGLRIWSAGHLIKSRRLVTTGPYRWVRNPLYLGRLLIFTGLCVAASLPYAANWFVLSGGWAVFFGYYMPRKERVEPARLRAIHGEAYERYRRAVPSLLPVRGAWADAERGRWSRDRALRNREHWMVVALAAVLVFLAWRAFG